MGNSIGMGTARRRSRSQLAGSRTSNQGGKQHGIFKMLFFRYLFYKTGFNLFISVSVVFPVNSFERSQ
jgi:hypothetical protein